MIFIISYNMKFYLRVYKIIGSDPRNLSINTFQLSIHQGILVNHYLSAFELQNHKSRHSVYFQRRVCSCHRTRIDELDAIVSRWFQLVRMSTDQDLDPKFFGLILKGLVIRPRNNLMAVDETDLDPTELKNLHETRITFSYGNSARVSSS